MWTGVSGYGIILKRRPGKDDIRCWGKVEYRQKVTWDVDWNVTDRESIKP